MYKSKSNKTFCIPERYNTRIRLKNNICKLTICTHKSKHYFVIKKKVLNANFKDFCYTKKSNLFCLFQLIRI